MQKPKSASKTVRKAAKNKPKPITLWFARTAIGFGLFAVITGTVWQVAHAENHPKTAQLPSPVAAAGEMPTRIIFPSVGITQPVSPARLQNGQWVVSDSGASYLIESARPGTAGNIITYGHDTSALFAKVHAVRIGDTITLQTAHSIYNYRVIATQVVAPSDVSILAPTKTELLTFYTCAGFLDTKRFVVQAVRI